jgi:hypothetical protein
MQNHAELILLWYGGAKKSSFEMNMEELEGAAYSILQRAKEGAFSEGRPIYFSRDGKAFAEFPD